MHYALIKVLPVPPDEPGPQFLPLAHRECRPICNLFVNQAYKFDIYGILLNAILAKQDRIKQPNNDHPKYLEKHSPHS